ncbi:MAG TPA: hypothetical protein VNG51_29005 [Ktedonobacteraceae bacterium]|nr:hypothetical protein [Ktedonobacteraceae bacterium]
MPLNPTPNLIHHLFSHMTSHGVGSGSSLLPASYGHKEVAAGDNMHQTLLHPQTARKTPSF